MASDAQILANRENARHSCGPVSAAGKRASSRNSTIHGAWVSIPALGAEELQQLHTLYDTLYADYGAETTSEALLVWDMAVAHFRRQRAIDAENEYFLADQKQFAETNPGETWTPGAAARRLTLSGDLPKMTRYQRTFERTWERKLAELRRLQADRCARRRNEEQDWQKEFDKQFDAEFEAAGARALAQAGKHFEEMLANSPFTQEDRDRMNAALAEFRKEEKSNKRR